MKKIPTYYIEWIQIKINSYYINIQEHSSKEIQKETIMSKVVSFINHLEHI